MNKIFLITLTTTGLATSGFSSGDPTYGGHIDSTLLVKEGADSIFRISHENYELSEAATINLSKSNTQSDVGKLVVDSGKFLKSAARTITSVGEETYNPKFTLDGTLIIESVSDKTPDLKDIEIDSSNTGEVYGLLDMSAVRSLRDQDTTEEVCEHICNIKIIAPTEGKNAPKVKLPFNCKFTNVDLSNASHVEYTCVSISEVVATEGQTIGTAEQMGTKEPVVGYLIQRDLKGRTCGDYAQNAELGVKFPTTPQGGLDVKKVTVTQQAHSEPIYLSTVVANHTYNANGYYLKTDDLDDVTQDIDANAECSLGLVGSKPIKVSGDHKVTFKGNNRAYAPGDNTLSLPKEVEFAGSGSLFQATQSYTHGTFTGGSDLSNTIPTGKTITFNNGFSLGTGHTLTVNGTLIG